MQKRLRIAFLSYKDPFNVKSWSGGYRSMFNALERNVGDVEWMGTGSNILLKIVSKLGRLYTSVFGKKYESTDNTFLSMYYAFTYSRRLRRYNPDVIFAPAAVPELAFLRTSIPVVYVSDATSVQFIEYYPSAVPVSSYSLKEIKFLENKALHKSSALCFSSTWAANDAVQRYQIPADNVHVIPFGSNFPVIPPAAEVINKTLALPVRLVFLGGDWYRKGAEIAYETMVELNRMGIETYLTILGCKPRENPERYNHPNFKNIGFLNMSVKEDLDVLIQEFKSAHFFILPSRAECAALAFCDANAYGLPVLTTNTGGITSFVKDGYNGFTLPLEATGKEFAEKVRLLHQQPEQYSTMVRQARQEFENRLNWDAWAKAIHNIINSKLS